MSLSPFLTKPVLNQIAPWDSTKSQTIGFMVNSGSQYYGNQIEIDREEIDGTWIQIHVNPITMGVAHQSMLPTHTILANTLQNEHRYRVRVRTYDITLTKFSPWSDYRSFYCLKEATAAIDGLTYYTFEQIQQGNNNLVTGGSLVASAIVDELSDLDGVVEYRFVLKDFDTKETVTVYPFRFFQSGKPMTEEIENVDKNRKYELFVTIVTRLGQNFSSPSYCVVFDYFLPNLTSIFQASNGGKDFMDGTEGAIVLQGHFVRLIFERDGEVDFEEVIELESEEEITKTILNAKNGKIFLEEGLNISGDWNLKVWIHSFDNQNIQPFLRIIDKELNEISLSYNHEHERFRLAKNKPNGESYQIYCDFPFDSLSSPTFVSISSKEPLQLLNLLCSKLEVE